MQKGVLAVNKFVTTGIGKFINEVEVELELDKKEEKIKELYGIIKQMNKEIKQAEIKDNADMVNKPPHYNIGEIETLVYIKDVLVHNKKLDAYEGYLNGNIIKYTGTRLGNKNSKLEDIQKAQFYADELESYNKEKKAI